MAYGSTTGVAALVPRFASSGDFSASTKPTKDQVIEFLTQVSAMINAILAQEGFATPVTEIDLLPIFDLFINEQVAAIVEGINGAGRLGPLLGQGQSGSGKNKYRAISADIKAFVKEQAAGLERIGADRPQDRFSVGYNVDDEGAVRDPYFTYGGVPGDNYDD